MGRGFSNDDPFARRVAIGNAHLDFTSLIDILFLLLIFFMYSAAVAIEQDVDTPAARQSDQTNPSDMTVVTILTSDVAGATPLFVLGNGKGEKGNIEAVKNYIADGKRAGHSQVMIKAERLVHHRFVNEVAKLVTKLDAGSVLIAVKESP
jgi:biopolymer transport protein ExbD